MRDAGRARLAGMKGRPLMARLALLAWLSALLAGLHSAPALADKRVALVIGNSAYRNVGRLDNPANDAKLLAETLRSLGFTLVGGGAQLDLDKPAFDRTVQSFGAQLAGADVGLFYYAGHGVQVRGENYLIPVDANPTKEADVDFQMLATNLVLRQMEAAGTKLNIVILDACRNNPFGGRSLAVGRARDAENDRMRDTGGGLAQMQAPEGTLISFATQPGSVAQDGADGNSPYTRALADTIRKPGLGIFDAFNQVGLAVKRATKGVQQPWVSSSPIDGAFYFMPPGGVAPAAVASGSAADEIAWNRLKSTTDVAALRRFADEFPSGTHRIEAEARIAVLAQEGRRLAALTPAAEPAPALVAPVAPLSEQQERALKSKDSFKECDNCPAMIAVPAGSFVMGSPASEPQRSADEGPQQEIAIPKMFAVGRTEVSFEEWFACVAEGGCNAYRPGDYGWGAGKRPVINVSWTDAKAYVKWLSAKTGATYRLLSESEREYVARGCTLPSCPSTPFWFGKEISPSRANYDWHYSYNGSAKAQPLGQTVASDASAPNPFGLLHVHGNVWEWVEDCWNASLAGQPKDGAPRVTGDCLRRVLRGGAWSAEPKDLRSAKRSWELVGERREEVGFRVARTLRN
jgi:formylglycine-generating enzyme required for sulfatase activity